jgi:hypothetical protein
VRGGTAAGVATEECYSDKAQCEQAECPTCHAERKPGFVMLERCVLSK